MLKHFLSIHSIVKCSSMAKVCTMGPKKHYGIVFDSPHGLRTTNESINQRNLKIWAYVADKIYFGRT